MGGINLRDRFEWDVGSELTPEEFSRQLAADLGIGGEFVTMIAHEIHEQLYRFKQDRLLDRGFEAEPLYSGFRHLEDAEAWAPALETLTAEEYERVLEDRERSVRYVFDTFCILLSLFPLSYMRISFCGMAANIRFIHFAVTL